jgi:hypothetical protein
VLVRLAWYVCAACQLHTVWSISPEPRPN